MAENVFRRQRVAFGSPIAFRNLRAAFALGGHGTANQFATRYFARIGF